MVFARLRFFFASEAAKIVILRRGPSQWTQMILWDVTTDQFQAGQWFRGSFLGGDLSPDGTIFLYEAAKYKGGMIHDNVWGALSKPPYFTAFALLYLSSRNLGQTMMFDTNTDILYNPTITSINPTRTKDGGELPEFFKLRPYQEQLPFYWKRLQRNGWRLLNPPDTSVKYPDPRITPFLWERVSGDAVLTARMGVPSYFLRPKQFIFEGQETLLENNEFVDFDQRGRLIAARKGQLLLLDPHDPNHKFSVLADFNDHKPESIPAPDWVKRW